MNTEEIIEQYEENVIHTYNRYSIVLEKGEGMYLTDTDGKQYLDFGSGIAVYALGYGNKVYNDALKNQIDKLIHTSNMFYTKQGAEAAQSLVKATGLSKVFFTNSGAEAIEGALKVAKKYANKKGIGDHEIIAMEHSFHGRSTGALSVTGNEHYREDFYPLIPNIKFAEYNNLESVKALVNDKTAAIMLETVQGEGGIRPATEEFLKGIKQICDEKDILLILDEIQCGMGRTGYMFAYQKYGILPDVVTVAKALGCGVPVGAFVMGEKVKDVLVAGDHGTTYGANPLVCTAAKTVFELFESMKIVDNVKNVGDYMYDRLEEIASKYPQIVEHRGVGFIQGLEFEEPVRALIDRMLDRGVITFQAGANVIRFIPPLIATKEDVDKMVGILEASING